jgi:hypothetical protein
VPYLLSSYIEPPHPALLPNGAQVRVPKIRIADYHLAAERISYFFHFVVFLWRICSEDNEWLFLVIIYHVLAIEGTSSLVAIIPWQRHSSSKISQVLLTSNPWSSLNITINCHLNFFESIFSWRANPASQCPEDLSLKIPFNRFISGESENWLQTLHLT